MENFAKNWFVCLAVVAFIGCVIAMAYAFTHNNQAEAPIYGIGAMLALAGGLGMRKAFQKKETTEDRIKRIYAGTSPDALVSGCNIAFPPEK